MVFVEHCRRADVERVQFLLEAGHDPNAEDARGITPLMAAVGAQGGLEVIKRLLIHGADTNLGCAPLCFFIGDERVHRWLNERHDYSSRFHFFEEFPTPLLVQTLKNGSFMLSLRTRLGRSPLDLAQSSDSNNAAMVRLAADRFSPEKAYLWPRFVCREASHLLLVFGRIINERGLALRDPLIQEVLPRCIGKRTTVEQWRRTLLCAFFLVKLQLLSHTRRG